MDERFLQLIWKTKKFDFNHLATTDDQEISIIHPGIHNKDSGPDFTDARIKIGDTLWAGNVEIHLKSSHWSKHGHSMNPAYDNIILHVVYEHDTEIRRNDKSAIPTLELRNRVAMSRLERFDLLMEGSDRIPCSSMFPKTATLIINNWLERCLVERLEYKIWAAGEIFDATNSDWEETCYRLTGSVFGSKINHDVFIELTKTIPLGVLARHKTNPGQIEALLFGQSGLLPESSENDYVKNLIKEYAFLKKKYSLIPLPRHLWKFMRLRPPSFPTVRIAQFAALVYHSMALFSKILECTDLIELKGFFRYSASVYWDTHYTFESQSPYSPKPVSEDMIDLLIINMVAPCLFLYAEKRGVRNLKERAIHFLSGLHMEKNNIIKEWIMLGVRPRSAAETQALIHLRKEYCEHKKCLDCAIGINIINS